MPLETAGFTFRSADGRHSHVYEVRIDHSRKSVMLAPFAGDLSCKSESQLVLWDQPEQLRFDLAGAAESFSDESREIN